MRKLLIGLGIVLLACNPVKQVLKDPEKFDKVKEAVIRGGYCVTDTVTVENISIKDSIIESKVFIPCPDFKNEKDGVIISSGVLSLKTPIKQKVIKVTNTVKDRSLENLLRKDLSERDSAIKVYMNLYEKTQLEVKALKAEKTALKWKLIWTLAIAGIVIFRKQLLKLASIWI